jgi:acyl-coenzyme A synthetase/AMP-(fatty) acid ligase
MPGRPPATTFESIEAIALRDPQRLALVQDHQSWTYHALYTDLLRVVRVLDDLGVKRGDRVAVGTEGLQAGLLLLLAAENIGAVTVSFLPEKDPDAQAVFALADWVFSDAPQDNTPASARHVPIDATFIDRVRAVNDADPRLLPRVALPLDEPLRITRTSGSTGRSKFMLLRRQAQEWWMNRVLTTGDLRRDSRMLLLGPLVLNANFVAASACLRRGAAALDLRRTGLAAHDITQVVGLPAMVEQVLDALPAGYASRRPVDVVTVGGFPSPQFRERCLRAFGGALRSRYGTNETGGICEEMDAHGVGVVGAGVDVRIVDESGADLPRGSLGIIAVRTPGMAEEYIGEPDASRAAFRDGWFHSGDWGTLVGPRTLRLAGRHDDLVNAGGVKLSAAQVEGQVRELVKPQDCAVLAVNLDAGETSLGIALVTGQAQPRDAIRRALSEGLQLGATVGAKVIFLAQLPRLLSGKIDRVALHRLFESPPPGSV